MNVYFFTPYSFEKNIGKEYNKYMSLIPNENDWGVLMDGDVLFLENNFGHIIKEYIDNYDDGNVGMFTCYASRTMNKELKPPYFYNENDFDMISQKERYINISNYFYLSIKEIKKHCSGFLLCIKKKVWNDVPCPETGSLHKADVEWSNKLKLNGYKLLCMEGLYVLHYYRSKEGIKFNNHLK